MFPAEPACITDTFEDGEIGTLWPLRVAMPRGVLAESNGRLSITLEPNQVGPAFNGVVSDFYDLNDASVEIEIPKVPSQGANVTVSLLDEDSGAPRQYGIIIRNDILELVADPPLVGEDRMTSFIAKDHRWFRLRHQSTTLFYELSPDRISWVVEHVHEVDVSHLRVVLAAGTNTVIATPGEAQFDNFAIRADDCSRF